MPKHRVLRVSQNNIVMSEKKENITTLVFLISAITIFITIGVITSNEGEKGTSSIEQIVSPNEAKSQRFDTELGFHPDNPTNDEKIEYINNVFLSLNKIYQVKMIITDNKYSPPIIKKYKGYLVFEKDIIKLLNGKKVVDSFRINPYQESATVKGNYLFNVVVINNKGQYCKVSLSKGTNGLSYDQLMQLSKEESEAHFELHRSLDNLPFTIKFYLISGKFGGEELISLFFNFENQRSWLITTPPY